MIRPIAAATAICAGLALTSPVSADLHHQDPALESGGVILDIRSAGLEGVTPDEKDRALFAALRTLDARLVELPEELEGDPSAVPAIQGGWDLLTSTMSLRIAMSDNGPGLTLVSRSGEGESPADFATRLVGIANGFGIQSRVQTDGSTAIMTPMGPLVISLVDQADGPAAAFMLGDGPAPDLAVDASHLPAGAEPWISYMFDIGGFMQAFEQMGGAEQAEQLRSMGMFGAWFGPDAPIVEGAIGTLGKDMHMVSRVRGARAAYVQAGASPDITFTASDFRAVPANPTRVFASPLNVPAYLGMYDTALQQAGEEDLLEDASEELGVDIRADLLENMGPRWMLYQSDATGGGGLLSTVALVDLADADTFGRAHQRLVERANAAGQEEASGYIRIRSWDAGGHQAFTFTTPGFPLPFEPSWAIAKGKLVAAVSPVGLTRAIQQLTDPHNSALDSSEFRRVIADRIPGTGAGQVFYVDVPRLAPSGYGLTNLLTSGIANGLRSPAEPERIKGPLMPPFEQFTKDTRAMGSVSWWEGDDLVQHTVMDRSVLVMTGASAATFTQMQGVAAPVLGVGVLLPALGKARLSAKMVISQANLRHLMMAATNYAIEHNDAYPESFEQLADAGFMPEMLESPFDPEPSWQDDYAIFAGKGSTFDSTQIVMIDLAMYRAAPDGLVAVAFADGHVESVPLWRLDEILDQPNNEGAREAFGLN